MMSMNDQNREALAVIVKTTVQKFGGPRLAEFANDPPIRKHYAVAEAILREFDVTPKPEDMGPAANCHLCVGAGGHEDYDGKWVECSCQRRSPRHDQHEEARLALESGVAAVEKIIRDRDVESHIAELRLNRLMALLKPSDAVIVDMLTAFYGEERDGWSMGKVRRMRAALGAVRGTGGEQ